MTETVEERRQEEGVRERAASTVQDAASATQEKAMELRARSADQLREQLDTRTTDVGRQAQSVGQALRQSGQKLREQGNAPAAGITEGAAQRVDDLGRYLERVSGDELLRDAEQFARRRPWVLAGIGFFGGLVASRMLKASSEQRYQTSQPNSRVGLVGEKPEVEREPSVVPDTSGREFSDAERRT